MPDTATLGDGCRRIPRFHQVDEAAKARTGAVVQEGAHHQGSSGARPPPLPARSRQRLSRLRLQTNRRVHREIRYDGGDRGLFANDTVARSGPSATPPLGISMPSLHAHACRCPGSDDRNQHRRGCAICGVGRSSRLIPRRFSSAAASAPWGHLEPRRASVARARRAGTLRRRRAWTGAQARTVGRDKCP